MGRERRVVSLEKMDDVKVETFSLPKWDLMITGRSSQEKA